MAETEQVGGAGMQEQGQGRRCDGRRSGGEGAGDGVGDARSG